MTDETEVLWSPGDVAKRLGVSPSGLRRLAGTYAELYGELPRDSSGTSRLWSSEAVNRLEAARALLAAGQARSIKDALLAIEGGATASADAALSLGQEGRVVEALGVVAARLEALQESNRGLREEIKALRGGGCYPAGATVPGQGDTAQRGRGSVACSSAAVARAALKRLKTKRTKAFWHYNAQELYSLTKY
jgi:DNA-binding transcriptional MerR regulator